ncbi:MAG: hypothetical protein ACLUAR_00735 [Pilosibacter sp.]
MIPDSVIPICSTESREAVRRRSTWSLIDHVLRKGRQAIVLIPEISLTYQTVMRFYRRFGNRVGIMNSRLSAGERYEQSGEGGKRGD